MGVDIKSGRHNQRITALVGQLREALVAREQAHIEARVSAQMAVLTKGLGGPDTRAKGGISSGGKTTGNRKPRSAASRAKQAARMRAYWKAKKAAAKK